MNVLLLSPRPQLLTQTIIKTGDDYEISMATPDLWPKDVDFIVSFGYRHIIKEPYLSQYEDRIINIHQSMLPWNRGDSPNFWSWFDDTPKGVSVHMIDAGLDTGDIIMQMEITKWHKGETLKSSYEFLNICASKLFEMEWARFRNNDWFVLRPTVAGSYHRSEEKDEWMKQLPLGWDSSVDDVKRLADKHRGH